jgi:hypothetical protein
MYLILWCPHTAKLIKIKYLLSTTYDIMYLEKRSQKRSAEHLRDFPQSSTLRRESGKRTYSRTASRMTSGLVLK